MSGAFDRTVWVAFTMLALSLLSPAILYYCGMDTMIIAIFPVLGLFITALICIPGTARLIVSISEHRGSGSEE